MQRDASEEELDDPAIWSSLVGNVIATIVSAYFYLQNSRGCRKGCKEGCGAGGGAGTGFSAEQLGKAFEQLKKLAEDVQRKKKRCACGKSCGAKSDYSDVSTQDTTTFKDGSTSYSNIVRPRRTEACPTTTPKKQISYDNRTFQHTEHSDSMLQSFNCGKRTQQSTVCPNETVASSTLYDSTVRDDWNKEVSQGVDGCDPCPSKQLVEQLKQSTGCARNLLKNMVSSGCDAKEKVDRETYYNVTTLEGDRLTVEPPPRRPRKPCCYGYSGCRKEKRCTRCLQTGGDIHFDMYSVRKANREFSNNILCLTGEGNCDQYCDGSKMKTPGNRAVVSDHSMFGCNSSNNTTEFRQVSKVDFNAFENELSKLLENLKTVMAEKGTDTKNEPEIEVLHDKNTHFSYAPAGARPQEGRNREAAFVPKEDTFASYGKYDNDYDSECSPHKCYKYRCSNETSTQSTEASSIPQQEKYIPDVPPLQLDIETAKKILTIIKQDQLNKSKEQQGSKGQSGRCPLGDCSKLNKQESMYHSTPKQTTRQDYQYHRPPSIFQDTSNVTYSVAPVYEDYGGYSTEGVPDESFSARRSGNASVYTSDSATEDYTNRSFMQTIRKEYRYPDDRRVIRTKVYKTTPSGVEGESPTSPFKRGNKLCSVEQVRPSSAPSYGRSIPLMPSDAIAVSIRDGKKI